MKVFVAADMEGVTGVAVGGHLMAGGHDYERARVWFTDDVNAAVEGAVAAGAQEVWVNDGHATMTNLLVDRLHEAARLVVGPARSVNKPLIQVTGIDHDVFDACIMVGYVAGASLHGITLSKLEIETQGELDLRGFLGLDPNVKPGYDSLTYVVRIKGNGTPEQFREIHETVKNTSPNYFNIAKPVAVDAVLVVED